MAEEKHVHGPDCDCGCNHDHDHHEHEHHEPEEYLRVAQRFAGRFSGGKLDGESVAVICFDGDARISPFHQASWANQVGGDVEQLLADDLSEWAVSTASKNVLFTGYEPLRQEMLVATMARLAISGVNRILVETTGVVAMDPVSQMRQTMEVMVAFGAASAEGIAIIQPVIDYRLSGEMADHMCMSNFNLLHKDDMLRFVISQPSDMPGMAQVISENSLKGRCQLACVADGVDTIQVKDFLASEGLADVRFLEPIAIVCD